MQVLNNFRAWATFYGKLPPLEVLERMMIGALTIFPELFEPFLATSLVGRARERSETQGFMKMLVDAENKQVLGAALLGTQKVAASAVPAAAQEEQ